MPWIEPLANPDTLRDWLPDPIAPAAVPAACQNCDMHQIRSGIPASLIRMSDRHDYDDHGGATDAR